MSPRADVAMLLPGPYPDIRVRKEAAALDAAGYRVTVFCTGGADDPRRETVDGVRVRRFPTTAPGARAAAAADAAGDLLTGVRPRWLAALDGFLRRRPAVAAVHVHDLPLVRTALAARRRHGVPVVADCHENYPEAVRQWHRTGADDPRTRAAQFVRRTAFPVARWKRIERRVLPAADRVLAVCDAARDHFVADCGVDAADAVVVSNAAELEVFDPDRVAADGRDPDPEPGSDDRDDRDGLTAVYVGGFGPHRGLATAVEAAARCPGVRLRLVGGGGGDTAARLRELAARRGVADRVDLPGWVPFERVPAVLAAADACLVPHAATPHTETTVPHKLFQYMAMGRPVVASDLRPLRAVVDDADAGLLAPAGDAAAWADAFAALRDDPDARARYGANGRRAAVDRYNWARDAARLVGVYRGLTG